MNDSLFTKDYSDSRPGLPADVGKWEGNEEGVQ